MKNKIAPSILSSNWNNIEEEIISLGNNYELIHVDIMDDIFVPNKTFDAEFVKRITKSVNINIDIDVHLMVNEPNEKYIKKFIDAGATNITIHIEAFKNKKIIYDIIKFIKSFNIKASIAIKPKTQIEEIKDFVPFVDMILVMTVEPGFGGQQFIECMADKICDLRNLYPDKDIQVDGGINEKTIKLAKSAGANIFVAGSSIFKNDSENGGRILAIEKLKSLL